jgi:uncharacterized protein
LILVLAVSQTSMPPFSELALAYVYRGDASGLEKLIADGHFLGGVDSDGRTLLMHAVLATPPDPTIVAQLLRTGIDVNAKDKGQQWTALAFAARDCSATICRMLLDAGAEVDSADVFGNTPLMRAEAARKHENADLLLSRRADAERANNYGVSPRDIREGR